MPIYVYKCKGCGELYEHHQHGFNAPRALVVRCDQADNPTGKMYAFRHHAGETIKTHTQGDYQFTPHFDAGAGRSFGSKAEYKAWQRANTDADGAMPEPVAGRRKVAMYEEAAHACEVNQQVQIDEKAQREALGKAYDAAHRELAACQAIGVKAPSLDD